MLGMACLEPWLSKESNEDGSITDLLAQLQLTTAGELMLGSQVRCPMNKATLGLIVFLCGSIKSDDHLN